MIKSPSELIEKLGGNPVVSALCGVGLSTVSGWRARGFPLWIHGKLIRECAVRRIAYDPELFEPKRRATRPSVPLPNSDTAGEPA